ncbi:MAG: thioredoxin [Verrucomicrobiota bacterium]
METNEKALTDANFDAETGKGVVLIDFWAPWCGPCLMQGPIIEKVAATMAGKAKIGKCNVDEAPQVSERFGIRSIPTLIILKDGKVVEQFVGVRQEAELVSALTKHIK